MRSLAVSTSAIASVRYAGLGVALLAAALLISRDGEFLAPQVRAELALPDAPSSLLLSAGFLASNDDTHYSVPFVAEDLSYTGIVRSDASAVAGRGAVTDPVTVQFDLAVAGRSGRAADAAGSALHFYSGRDGQASPNSFGRFQTIDFLEVYPGIDAKYRTTKGNLEVDFIVHPWADADVVRIVPAHDVAIRRKPRPVTSCCPIQQRTSGCMHHRPISWLVTANKKSRFKRESTATQFGLKLAVMTNRESWSSIR